MTNTDRHGFRRAAVALPHSGVFWPGIGPCTAGVLLVDAEARLRRHQASIEAGVDPAAIVVAA